VFKVNLPTLDVISYPITASPRNSQLRTILDWAEKRLSKVVCVANVHMLMEARWHLDFDCVLRNADLVVPDGMPLVWMIRWMGFKDQDRVAGLDVLTGVCELAQATGVGVYFLGSEANVLEQMRLRLNQEFPELSIAGMEPLPFRPLTMAEDEALIERVNDSGAGVVLVALGCPKQEHWMATHQYKINAVMIGLGAAFLVYAGIYQRAPEWIREAGLEWLYRLIQEPRRLWKRYAATIPPFVYLALKQLAADFRQARLSR
jgi:N-acetylglucosaminyldiphosphoundecaprenol N-acetyl-beta-D-mannosaminyltransferase